MSRPPIKGRSSRVRLDFEFFTLRRPAGTLCKRNLCLILSALDYSTKRHAQSDTGRT
jgi:hypothetical protein